MRQDATDITIVLDRSGSMAAIEPETRQGVQTFIEAQRKVPGSCVLSLVLFDDCIERPFTARPIAEIAHVPLVPRGATALLDAMGTAIEATGKRLEAMSEADRPARVIVVTVTDGYENASRKFDVSRISTMISHQRGVYGWDFVFLGANQDAIATAASMSIPAATAMTYAVNDVAVENVYMAAGGLVARSRTSGCSLDSVGFSDEDRAKSTSGPIAKKIGPLPLPD